MVVPEEHFTDLSGCSMLPTLATGLNKKQAAAGF